MKKITFLICTLFFTVILFSQPGFNWDNPVSNGFSDASRRVTATINYNNNLYTGTSYGSLNSGIYISSSVRSGSFYRDGGYDAVHDTNDVGIFSFCKSPSGELFAGSQNYINGGKLYRFNGSIWDSIPYPLFSFPTSYFPRISNIGVFNIGGTDSLYVCWESNQTGAEIWKTSASNPGAGWVQAFVKGGITLNGTDMIFFNSKINVLFADGALFSSSDGITWAPDPNAAAGFGNALNTVRAITIHNNELYAGCENGTSGVQIWKTSDLNTWTPCDTTGFTNGNNLYQMSDMYSAYGKLWVATIASGFVTINKVAGNSGNINGGSNGPVVHSSATGIGYVRENNPLFSDNSNYQDFYLYASANKVLCWGWNFSRGGVMYTKCLTPTASLTASTDTTCESSPYTLTSTSTNTDSVEWTLNGFPYDYNNPLNTTSPSAGIDTFRLYAFNGGCVDSLIFPMTVLPALNIDSIRPGIGIVCTGTIYNPTAYVSGPLLQANYKWETSVDTVSGMSPVITVIGGNYTVAVSNAYGCQASTSFYITAIPPVNLGGTVSYSGGPVANANVFAIKVGTSSALYDTVATVLTDGAGFYNFTSLFAGNYIIRVESDTTIYHNTLNTYYGNVYLWDSSIIYHHYCDSNITQANIQLIEFTPPVGPGSLTGIVYEGAGFGLRTMPGPDPVVMTNVIPGVPVKVGKNPSGNIVASGTTDPTGRYTFNNLPYNTYRIYTDIPGYPMDSSYLVTLSASSDSIVNLDYFVDSNSVYIDLTLSKNEIKSMTNNNLILFPNPAKASVNINLTTETDEKVLVRIIDVTGREIYAQNFGTIKSGNKKINLDLNQNGIAPGIYFVQLKAGEKNFTGKLIVE